MRAVVLVMAVGLSLCTADAAFAQQPRLFSATQVRGRIIVTFELSGLAPGEFVVARRSRRLATGAFAPANVVLRETIRVRASSGIVRYRSRKTLGPGTYYVEVSGVDLGGITDCVPHQSGCGEEWSNVQRLVIQ